MTRLARIAAIVACTWLAVTPLVHAAETPKRGGVLTFLIPADAPPKVERYAYQFYVGPSPDRLKPLIDMLPPERRERWRSKDENAATDT